MKNNTELYSELEDIYHKYERLTSLISIVQMCVAEVAGIPSNSLNDALFEVEIGMDGNNKRLKELFKKKGGAA